MVALTTHNKWNIFHIDVKTAFLNGDLKKEVYMIQLESFVVKRKELKVCQLDKAHYGLHQAFWVWYENINHYLKE